MVLINNKQNIPAPEPDSIPDSSSPDSSSPEAGSIPDESSPEADSIPDKSGKIKLRIVVNGYGAYLFWEIWFFDGFLCVLITSKSTSGKWHRHKIIIL